MLFTDPRQLSAVAFNRLIVSDWMGADKLIDPMRHLIAKGGWVGSFTSIGLGFNAFEQWQSARNFARHVAASRSRLPFRHLPAVPADRLRVAYLSSDFRHHPLSYDIVGLIECHDRTKFEIIGVSFGGDAGSDIRRRIIAAFDEFHDVPFHTDAGVADFLYDLHVHIAVDLNGLTKGNRPGVWACRPAPVQVNWQGFPGTTGSDYMDYIIADETVLPFDQQPFFSERIVHLPDCYLANDMPAHQPLRWFEKTSTPARPELGLPAQGLVFCCFNQSWKITGPVFDIWMRLLARVPESVLWLLKMTDLGEANLKHEATARGIDPDRLIFAPWFDIDSHLARLRGADLFLDTLFYNAHSTGSAALWAGVPVVTCVGPTFPGRVGASMLKAVGMPELVTHSLEEYEALALRLATDPALLSSMRLKLENNRLIYPLFDGDRFRRGIEAAYTTMWDIHRGGGDPCSFRVPAWPP
jgi:protein O-GlcNAc transferase